MRRIAVYAASLDPITYGHIDISERIAPLYDEVFVLVAVDPRKNYTFSPDERVELASRALAHLPNVTVQACIGRYVVKVAEELGAKVIIRGLRNFSDLEGEQALAEENHRIVPGIETIWLPCRPELAYVSSSMVRNHVGVDPGWEKEVTRLVPAHVVVRLKEKFIESRAHRHWTGLMGRLGKPAGSESVLANLLNRYWQAGRAYHTLEHIVSMLEEFEPLIGLAANPVAIKLAIWYHDAIYETAPRKPGSPSNEEWSAEIAKKDFALLGIAEELTAEVCDPTGLIMATRHLTPPETPDQQLLVDLDLAILGKSEAEFDRYETNIRKEYWFVPEADFRKGRAAILRSFLERPAIYSTSFFRERYEAAARQNLERSIKKLQ